MFDMKKNIIPIVLTLAVLMAGASAVFAEDAVTIKMLFNLLPEKALSPTFKNFNLDAARRNSYIAICDEENRYLNLQDKYGFEMCYWNLKGGKKLILVSYGGDGPEVFYLYNKGKISETNDFGIKALKEHVKKSPAFEDMDDWIRFYPPRHGTSLTVMINQLDCIIFKWKNEKFVRLSDYPQKNSDHFTLAKGFVQALNAHDADACLQYIKPDYIADQCMYVLKGRTEQFICELIGGETKPTATKDSEFITPSSLQDIKNATYKYDPDSGFANHIITIELKDGRLYNYYVSFENLELGTQMIPFIVGAMG